MGKCCFRYVGELPWQKKITKQELSGNTNYKCKTGKIGKQDLLHFLDTNLWRRRVAKKQIEGKPRKSKFKSMSHTGGNSRPLKDKVVRIGNKWFMKKQETQDENRQ